MAKTFYFKTESVEERNQLLLLLTLLGYRWVGVDHYTPDKIPEIELSYPQKSWPIVVVVENYKALDGRTPGFNEEPLLRLADGLPLEVINFVNNQPIYVNDTSTDFNDDGSVNIDGIDVSVEQLDAIHERSLQRRQKQSA